MDKVQFDNGKAAELQQMFEDLGFEFTMDEGVFYTTFTFEDEDDFEFASNLPEATAQWKADKFSPDYWDGALYTRTAMAHAHSRRAALFLIQQIEFLLKQEGAVSTAVNEFLRASLKTVEEL